MMSKKTSRTKTYFRNVDKFSQHFLQIFIYLYQGFENAFAQNYYAFQIRIGVIMGIHTSN